MGAIWGLGLAVREGLARCVMLAERGWRRRSESARGSAGSCGDRNLPHVGKVLRVFFRHDRRHLRRLHRLNAIAFRKPGQEEAYTYFAPDYRLQAGDVLLIAGAPSGIAEFAKVQLRAEAPAIGRPLDRLFSRFRRSKPGF